MGMVRAFLARTAVLLAALCAPIALAWAASERLPVPAVTIYPGDMITPGMLTTGEFVAGSGETLAVARSTEELVGKVARRTLLPGRLIARNSISAPMLVQKGTIVSAEYRQGGLVITASALALQSGALADIIQLRNIDSGKTIVGAVQADGSVRIGGK
jgi:flagella basal body P-ring formation protein FlgA